MKRTTRINTTTALLLAVAAVPALAADPDIPDRGPMPFDGMDTDHDGYVSLEEYRSARDKRLQQRAGEQERHQYRNMDEAPRHEDIDTDGDGRVSREEFHAYRQGRMQQRTQERAERQQQREERHQEMMERHQERVDEMREQRLGEPAGGTGQGGGTR